VELRSRTRFNIARRHAAGVEVLGSLQSDGTTEALLGYYGRLSPNFTVNAGVGRGVDRGPDWTARTLSSGVFADTGTVRNADINRTPARHLEGTGHS
jgi:hypothetical protein